MLGSEDRQISHFLVSLFHWFSTWHKKKKIKQGKTLQSLHYLNDQHQIPKTGNWRNSPLLGANAPLTTTNCESGEIQTLWQPHWLLCGINISDHSLFW